ncbi:hypothetical protein CK203_031229 [Vitis vinifera]|uniref:Uncharacterized protein n=1 Tax=Vitis vinifera TaxID=29760 RepID=A0A438IX72_VITVI|nr:hypothetical protein CK203_031229 [Vitis vinifera]
MGCRGSACVEVMTTLHGNAPSFRRRVEGCVPPEGSNLCSQSGFTFLDQSRGKIGSVFKEIGMRHFMTRCHLHCHHCSDSASGLTYMLHGHSEIAPLAVVQTTIIDDAHDGFAIWDDLEGMPMASLPG